MEILLMFAVLVGSFAAIGLLIPFSNHILRAIDVSTANSPRDIAQQERTNSLSPVDPQPSAPAATGI